jgi:glucose/mannose transport system permease protein
MRDSRRNTMTALLVLLPSAILLGVFVYGFIGNTIYVSLTDWGSGAGLRENPIKNFIGLQNYRELFGGLINARFRQDLINAIFYSVFLLIGALSVGLTLAILLDHGPKGESIYRSIFLYPMALSFVVTGTIWRWLLAPSGGVNLIPTWFGLKKIEFLWLSSREQVLTFDWQNVPQILAVILLAVFGIGAYRQFVRGHRSQSIVNAVFAVVALIYATVIHGLIPPILPYEERHGLNLGLLGVSLASIWQYAGYTMALYLAGLRGLPPNLYESAMIDGASDFTYYFKIAIPNMLPITLSAVIVLSHISLKLFALIFSMAGADNASTGHPSVLMYLTTFRANEFATGAAIAVVLFLLAATFIVPYLINSYRQRG